MMLSGCRANGMVAIERSNRLMMQNEPAAVVGPSLNKNNEIVVRNNSSRALVA